MQQLEFLDSLVSISNWFQVHIYFDLCAVLTVEGVFSPPCLLDLCVWHISVTIGAGQGARGEQRVSSFLLVLSGSCLAPYL